MPAIHHHRAQDLLLYGITLGLTAACALAFAWCLWIGMTGTADQQTSAYYASIIPTIIGSITTVLTALLHPR